MSEPADGSPSTKPECELTPLPADAPWWARWLRDNWQQIYREWSSWLISAAGALAALNELLPALSPSLAEHLNPMVMNWLTAACAIAALIAKFVKQRRPA